jgi:hypothetical protein
MSIDIIDEKNSLESYILIVKEAAESKRKENIPNSTMAHAEIGVRFLLKNAREGSIIQIVSNEFFDEFWGRLRGVLSDFIKKAGSLEVVLLKKKNRLLEDLQKEYVDNVKVYLMRDDVPNKDKIAHFFVVDPVGYRAELSDELMKDQIVKGVLNFGDVDGSRELRSDFERLKSLSIKV